MLLGLHGRRDDLIARSPEAKEHDLSPRELAELIFAVSDGMLMREVLQAGRNDDL